MNPALAAVGGRKKKSELFLFLLLSFFGMFADVK